MLSTLRIKNLALVEDLSIELRPGYNVITGETGAGKSIVIGALTLVLGGRADRTLIRNGSDSCSVEAMFDTQGLTPMLAELLDRNGLEPCEDDQLILKRTLSATGTNRQFVNGSPTTLAVLAEIGEWLVDIHGPHDHQSLLRPATQLSMLDSFGDLEEFRIKFAGLLERRAALDAEKAGLFVDERSYHQQLELLRFQTGEISRACLQAKEDERVEQDYQRASNSARLLELGQAALDLLGEQETSLLTQAGALGRTLQEIQRLDDSAAQIVQTHEQAVGGLRELQTAISHYLDRVDVDPDQLRQLEERLNLLQSLKRKYGSSLQEIIAFGAEAERRLGALEQRDVELARLDLELERLSAELWTLGKALSGRRRKLIPQLNKAVGSHLAQLGFRQSRFEVNLSTLDELEVKKKGARPPAHGLDSVEFEFAPNPGEPLRALRAIASSGELARVMLALKTVLAAQDRIPVLVFDEVDANVGGETAHAVGEKMRRISEKRQVLCITHLPQVAAPAATHYLVSKELKGGRTITQITVLEKTARVTELARMLGGQTEAARKHAEALLAQK
jgi:DNA repair protein RecN (Recombination protein N)